MRLLIIGSLDGHIGGASKIAIARGATVTHVDSIDGGLEVLRSGQGAELVMVDVRQEVARLTQNLKSERIHVPVIACGIGTDAAAAVKAIKAGAKEYVPLPPNDELIGAVLAAVTEESHSIIYRGPALARVLRLADQVAASSASVLISGPSGTGDRKSTRLNSSHSAKSRMPSSA